MRYGEPNSCCEKGHCIHLYNGFCKLYQRIAKEKCNDYLSILEVELSDVIHADLQKNLEEKEK
jgi:hypothetical protein